MIIYEIVHILIMVVLCSFPLVIFGGIVWAVIKEGRERIESINNKDKGEEGNGE